MPAERSSAASSSETWRAGPLLHVIPTASHERFLVKISLRSASAEAPHLRVDDRQVPGCQTDVAGRCFQFDVSNLQPATTYELQLVAQDGGPLSDPWPLKTHPAPDATADHLRILAYTCAGGFDGPPLNGQTIWLDMAARRRLLARAMAFQPDVVIANGDQIYWDLRTVENKSQEFMDHFRRHWWGRFGTFDRSIPASSGDNDQVLQAICDYQIAGLYGCTLRSTPSYFQTDDHDMFENDEFDAHLATLPPGEFGQGGEDATQLRCYPEFLPTRGRPPYLWGSAGPGRVPGVNQFFGGIRFGQLIEVVMYDCRRFVDSKGIHARAVPRWTEEWLKSRTLTEDTRHFLHSPSLPFGYSSGKLGDWYPDVLNPDGRLVMDLPKQGWQPGWLHQAQRIMEMLNAQRTRRAVVIQGDFHATAAGTITRSGETRLDRNPVEIVLVGTLGTGDLPFPSSFRNVNSTPSGTLEMDEALRPIEKNGFTIIDVTPEQMTFRLFVWRPPQPEEQIDTMDPVMTYEVQASPRNRQAAVT